MLRLTGQSVTVGYRYGPGSAVLSKCSPGGCESGTSNREGSEAPVRARHADWLRLLAAKYPVRARPCTLTPGEARRTHDATFERRSQLYDRSCTRKEKPPVLANRSKGEAL